ncbi:MAG: hypothetical protein ACRDMX_03490, partial [Solirubrobacteraceae bacterium]
ADDLARAVIAWSFMSLTFLLPRAIAEPDSVSSDTQSARASPEPRSLVAHRLRVAADHPTAKLPALRDLADQVHDQCSHQWGKHQLALAPAFRHTHNHNER